ncbi:MAG: histidinol-phosphatase HisJ family protein [Candidatus Cloacimonas sp.]
MKKLKIDYHMHSKFSADSTASMDEMIEKAIATGYQEIAFTEHFDLIPEEIEIYGVPSYRKYSLAIEEMRRRYPEISILKGVELGEYHLCHKLADAIMKNSPPDLKIGSIHTLSNGKNISIPLTFPLVAEDIKDYYESNLQLVKYGDFDILGHLGVQNRYLTKEPDDSFVLHIVKEIFSLIIKKEIALEVNYSGLTKPLADLIPTTKHLKLYKDMGGKLLTIGSDAHSVESLDYSYKKTLHKLLNLGFTHFSKINAEGWEQIEI